MKVKIPITYSIIDNKVQIIPTNGLLNGAKYFINATTDLQGVSTSYLENNFISNFTVLDFENLKCSLTLSFYSSPT